MSTPVKVAVAGVGQRGLQHVAALVALQEHEEARLVALADPNPDNLVETNIKQKVPAYRQRDIGLFDDVDDLIKEARPDAVLFVIPPNLHKREIVRAVRKGIHVLAEKPMTLFFDEAKEMADEIEKAGVISTVGFQMRYDNWYGVLREHLADKTMASVSMVVIAPVESHGVKHTAAEKLGGPKSRIWTAHRAWSGTTVVEAGIHQTDLMRFWGHDDVAWVQSAYVPRPAADVEEQGDNPIAYHVTYGFKKGWVASLIFTRPGRVMANERYDYILSSRSLVKFEDDLVGYWYEGKEFRPAKRPTDAELRHILARGPHQDAMGQHNTLKLDQAFVRAVSQQDQGLLKTDFRGGLNSLAAVLAANVSDERKGERVSIDAFSNSPQYAKYRTKPPAS
ncbi:MAG: Gfo/Idh/MocA family oxidoreductase [SAR202 cluster bacterium]|nr:Gfo/Idh/MocA family oxidoreductase [SAR202 cluster bacterium]